MTSPRRYQPLDNGGAVRPSEDFDVQAARRRAQREAARAIDARHLLLGFLVSLNEPTAALTARPSSPSPAAGSTSFGRCSARTEPGQQHHPSSLRRLDNNIEIPNGRARPDHRPRPDARRR
jgi:hypothetical protein